MQSPYIGRGVAFVVIVGLVCWTAFRALGSRPPETPKIPIPVPAIDAPLATAKSLQSAVLAGGCFWGVQAVFEHLKGVSSVTSGYSGGYVKSPSYESVSMGVTGHAETVSIIYDPSQLTYGQLLRVFFLRRARSHAMESPRSGHRLPIPLRDFLYQRGAEAHRSGLYRATWRREGLLSAHRHESRALPGFLRRRGLPSGFPQEQSR